MGDIFDAIRDEGVVISLSEKAAEVMAPPSIEDLELFSRGDAFMSGGGEEGAIGLGRRPSPAPAPVTAPVGGGGVGRGGFTKIQAPKDLPFSLEGSGASVQKLADLIAGGRF